MNQERSIGYRILAYFIDGLIIGLLRSVLTMAGLGVQVEIFGVVSRQLTTLQNMLLIMVYFVGFAVFNQGLTFGKLALNLKIKTTDGNQPSHNQVIIREAVKAILMPISLISFIICLVRDDRKALHDMIADTIVVRMIQGNETVYRDTTSKSETDPLEDEYKVNDDDYYQ